MPTSNDIEGSTTTQYVTLIDTATDTTLYEGLTLVEQDTCLVLDDNRAAGLVSLDFWPQSSIRQLDRSLVFF